MPTFFIRCNKTSYMSYLKEQGRKGHPTYTFNGKYLYSRYDPYKEAANYLKQLGPLKEIAITFGGADYLNGALSAASGVEKIISFEPIPFEKLADSNKIVRITDIESLKKYVMEQQISIAAVSLICWQPFIETDTTLFLDYLHKIRGALEKSTYSAGTADEFSTREEKNLLLNIEGLNELNCLVNSSCRWSCPAMIVSSGYSLADNIDYIKAVRERIMLFALPSALPFLLSQDIYPDYTIAVDPGYATYYHLARAAWHLSQGERLELITTLSLTPSIFSFTETFSFNLFSYGGRLEKELYRGLDIITANSEGSVIFNTLRILKSLGFGKVILVGQDFGFKDGRSHVNEGFFEREFALQASYAAPLEQLLKGAECAKPFAMLKDGDREIRSDAALRVYYEHFLDSDFGLEILLPEKPFNRLGGSYRVAERDYMQNSFLPLQERRAITACYEIDEVRTALQGAGGRLLIEQAMPNEPCFLKKYFNR